MKIVRNVKCVCVRVSEKEEQQKIRRSGRSVSAHFARSSISAIKPAAHAHAHALARTQHGRRVVVVHQGPRSYTALIAAKYYNHARSDGAAAEELRGCGGRRFVRVDVCSTHTRTETTHSHTNEYCWYASYTI